MEKVLQSRYTHVWIPFIINLQYLCSNNTLFRSFLVIEQVYSASIWLRFLDILLTQLSLNFEVNEYVNMTIIWFVIACHRSIYGLEGILTTFSLFSRSFAFFFYIEDPNWGIIISAKRYLNLLLMVFILNL